MGVSIEVWRARIGAFGGNEGNDILIVSIPLSKMLSLIYLLCVIVVLLLIGNIEMNPGPLDYFPCHLCDFKATSAEQQIYHQRVHSTLPNYNFTCPHPTCPQRYDSYRSMSAHLSQHSSPRNQVFGETDKFKCAYCEQLVSSNREYCKHLKEHLKCGADVPCPLPPCSRNLAFNSLSVFASHLSQCHPGWLRDYSTSACPGAPPQQATAGASVDRPYDKPNVHEEPGNEAMDVATNEDEFFYGEPMDDDDDGTTSTSSSDSFAGDRTYDHDQIVCFIANFYAFLEGEKIVPSSTVDALADKLGFISEILQRKLKEDLSICLKSVGVSERDTTKVIQGITSMDPLFNAHHAHAPGDCLLTSARRMTYYSKHFKYQEPSQINLKKNPKDTEDTVQYVKVKETLKVMLADPSVQKEVDESFCAPDSDGSVFKNYTDGSVFRESATPKKRIDLFFYMDAFTCANPLGSAKLKYKIHGIYMTLGNLKPYMRSFLKALKLVLLVNDKSLKKSDRMYQKTFSKLLKELKDLEKNGIEYKGEIIAVRVQFIQGDNLGQHSLGGFLESFSGGYMCRYCDLSNEEFKEQAKQENPVFRSGNWRTPESFSHNLREHLTRNNRNNIVHYKGVKRDSPFHQLQHFHVCHPRLPPCLGHDLFIGGVVDRDLASILNEFIEKELISREVLNMRIKRFQYLDKDGRNKPAEFTSTKKLGGHAIQNWTLLRLLPLIIGDKIDTNSNLWKLYLLLKSSVEMICAPELSSQQVEQLRHLINKYMSERKQLPNNYLPKHHFFFHYADLYLFFGPLIHMWTMAFEHRHQYFKRVAHICRNFINLGSLLANKFQLLQAYLNMGPLFSDSPVFSKSSPLGYGVFEEAVGRFLTTCQFSSDAIEVPKLRLNEINYNKNQWMLLGKSGDGAIIYVGQIEVLVYDGNQCFSIVKKYRAQKWEEYGLFCIENVEPEICSISLSSELQNPCTHAVYEFMGKKCFSLKHALLN